MEMIENSKSDATRNLSYLLIGGGIGATLALLFAPKAGSELRGDISKVTSNGIDKTRETVNQVRESAGNYYENVKDKASELYNTTADKIGQVADSVKKLPEQAEDLIKEKVEQIDEAVEAGQKEYQKDKSKTAKS
jgi:gas vesicle protein